ncbi:MAG: TonB-dependent receptor plug domain-containing protein, partial [Paludibacter sp.]
MKSSYKLILLLVFFASTLPAFAQRVVQGTISSKNDGYPLIGVNVTEVDANNRVISGTVTDFDGKYVLKIKSNDNRLTFSYVGYTKQERKIGTAGVINVELNEITQQIRDVTVTAQRRQTEGGFSIPKRELATAVQTIEMKEVEGIQVSSIDEALQGRIAGLDIVANSGDPGSGTSMRIRGASSINGNNQPLIVLNGVPYEMQVDQSFDYANSNQEQYANLLSINPDDIQEISVLKDAAASAMYGNRGANGVLLIKTKRGAVTKPTLS